MRILSKVCLSDLIRKRNRNKITEWEELDNMLLSIKSSFRKSLWVCIRRETNIALFARVTRLSAPAASLNRENCIRTVNKGEQLFDKRNAGNCELR